MLKQVEIFTDGSCLGNPGPGGYGAILRYRGREKTFSAGYTRTTNNRMELMAAIVALEALKEHCEVILSTDSQYVRQGITQWIHNWKKRGWKTADKKPVKNVDLWQRLDAALGQHQIKWEWVKGHAGHPENERCDELAHAAAMNPTLEDTAIKSKFKPVVYDIAGWRRLPGEFAVCFYSVSSDLALKEQSVSGQQLVVSNQAQECACSIVFHRACSTGEHGNGWRVALQNSTKRASPVAASE